MTNRSRVAITVATALALGASTYGQEFDISPPGVLQDFWGASVWVLLGLAVLGVFAVYRWWALLPAIAPLAVMTYLYNLTDYVAPYRGEMIIRLSDGPAAYVFLATLSVGLTAAILSVGLLLRAGWEWIRSWRRRALLPDPA